MEANTSKAQLEVWEWKNTLHEELKTVPKSERLKFIKEKVRKTIEHLKLAKKADELMSP
ncbi:MAG: hypothetical protein M0Q38_09165 [Bacteroidales bacterium]|jgi:hypothetical protein|nr:hypothetical protein [Bacteroidales bacterium]